MRPKLSTESGKGSEEEAEQPEASKGSDKMGEDFFCDDEFFQAVKDAEVDFLGQEQADPNNTNKKEEGYIFRAPASSAAAEEDAAEEDG